MSWSDIIWRGKTRIDVWHGSTFWHRSTFLTQIDRKQKFCSLVCQFQKGKNRLDRTKFDVAKHGSTFWPCRHRSTKLWWSVFACCVEWVSLPKWDATAKKSSIFYLASLKFWSEWVSKTKSKFTWNYLHYMYYAPCIALPWEPYWNALYVLWPFALTHHLMILIVLHSFSFSFS